MYENIPSPIFRFIHKKYFLNICWKMVASFEPLIVVLECEDCCVAVHESVLIEESEVFRAMLSENWIEEGQGSKLLSKKVFFDRFDFNLTLKEDS